MNNLTFRSAAIPLCLRTPPKPASLLRVNPCGNVVFFYRVTWTISCVLYTCTLYMYIVKITLLRFNSHFTSLCRKYINNCIHIHISAYYLDDHAVIVKKKPTTLPPCFFIRLPIVLLCFKAKPFHLQLYGKVWSHVKFNNLDAEILISKLIGSISLEYLQMRRG